VLPAHLAGAFILPSAAFGEPRGQSLGTGRYRVERWEPGRRLLLRRNPHFRGPQPAFERVSLRVIPNDRQRVAAVLTGQAQMADHVPPDDLARLQQRSDVSVLSRAGPRVLYLAYRMDERPFADPRVREALDLALDRDELIRRALAGSATPATQLVTPDVLGFNPSILLPQPNRRRSRELLEAAGYAQGFELVLDGPDNRYVNDVAILQEVARQLAEVGVRVQPNPMPKEPFFERVERGRSRFYLYGWACETGHAGEALNPLMHTRSSGPLGNVNTQGFSDSQLDRLIDEAERSPALSARAKLLAAALARVAELRPVLPLVVQHESFLLSKTIAWDAPVDMAPRLASIRPAGSP
jgi:peptide/nickel transport system substrate-binding protein